MTFMSQPAKMDTLQPIGVLHTGRIVGRQIGLTNRGTGMECVGDINVDVSKVSACYVHLCTWYCDTM